MFAGEIFRNSFANVSEFDAVTYKMFNREFDLVLRKSRFHMSCD